MVTTERPVPKKMTPENAQIGPSRPFSDTVAFYNARIAEIVETSGALPEEMSPSIVYDVVKIDLPKLSKQPVTHTNYKTAMDLYFRTDNMYHLDIQGYFESQGIEVSVERIRQYIADGIRILHETASRDLQLAYPLQDFSFRKPLNEEKRQAFSKTLRDKDGYTPRAEKKPHITKPRTGERSKTIQGLRDENTRHADVRELLKKIDVETYSRYKRRQDPLFASFAEILKSAGIPYNHLHIGEFVRMLEDKYGIGYGEVTRKVHYQGKDRPQTYRFTLTRYGNEIAEIVHHDEELQEVMSPPEILRIAGPDTTKSPNTTDIRRNEDYTYVITAIARILGVSPQKLHSFEAHNEGVEIIDDRCPVAVWRYRHVKSIQRADLNNLEFRRYIKQRIDELGIQY